MLVTKVYSVTADDLKSEARFREKLGPISDKLSAGAKNLSKFASSFFSDPLSSSSINETVNKSDNPDYNGTADNSANKTKGFDSKEESFHNDSSKKDNNIITNPAQKLNTHSNKISETRQKAMGKELSSFLFLTKFIKILFSCSNFLSLSLILSCKALPFNFHF